MWRISITNVITDLDLSALESITPDDAVTRFRYVIRNLPGVAFTGSETGDRRSGLWQWLSDSWELAWQDQGLAHPAIRAAGIRIVVATKKNRYRRLSPGLAFQKTKVDETASEAEPRRTKYGSSTPFHTRTVRAVMAVEANIATAANSAALTVDNACHLWTTVEYRPSVRTARDGTDGRDRSC